MKAKHWENLTRREKIARWKNLLRVLTSLTPHQRRKHFDMSDWLNVTACGTTGCAAGHAALDPWFNRRGFGAKFFVNTTANYGLRGQRTTPEKIQALIKEHGEDNVNSWEDFTCDPLDFFGSLGYEKILTGSRCRTYVTVTKAIRAYIKEGCPDWSGA